MGVGVGVGVGVGAGVGVGVGVGVGLCAGVAGCEHGRVWMWVCELGRLYITLEAQGGWLPVHKWPAVVVGDAIVLLEGGLPWVPVFQSASAKWLSPS